MNKVALLLCSLFLGSNVLAAMPYDHIHLTATSAQDAVNWYVKNFGGSAGRFNRGDADRVQYPVDRVFYDEISVIFFEREPTGGSVGTGVDHIGFSMSNVEQVTAAAVADGATQIGDFFEFSGMKIAFIEDPWGTKIELIDDPDTRGLHHIHLSSPDPAAALDWYREVFGGELEQWKGVLPAINYSDVWLMAAQANGEIVPTQGRAMDHLGWAAENLDNFGDILEANNVEFTMEPTPFRGIRISFVEGPDGVRIEVVEPD
ncbi:MAG: VOC family protein [Gammaproteobacteria bacterium]|nr:VOC family protein [Gammaproteobacteria bacterium]MDD9896040.1 VOC family protein [Gammaproteobacteria bacterium]MDD9957686.1 VOC family protein [Gammaproteobacteria bacterium]